MQLSLQNKLQLLCDILDEHQSDSSVSPNEHAQLERLTASLLAQQELSDQDIQDVDAHLPIWQRWDCCIRSDKTYW